MDMLDPRAIKCVLLGIHIQKRGTNVMMWVLGSFTWQKFMVYESIPYFTSSSKEEIITELFPFSSIKTSSDFKKL